MNEEVEIMACTLEGLLTSALTQQPFFSNGGKPISGPVAQKKKHVFHLTDLLAESKYLPAQVLLLLQ